MSSNGTPTVLPGVHEMLAGSGPFLGCESRMPYFPHPASTNSNSELGTRALRSVKIPSIAASLDEGAPLPIIGNRSERPELPEPPSTAADLEDGRLRPIKNPQGKLPELPELSSIINRSWDTVPSLPLSSAYPGGQPRCLRADATPDTVRQTTAPDSPSPPDHDLRYIARTALDSSYTEVALNEGSAMESLEKRLEMSKQRQESAETEKQMLRKDLEEAKKTIKELKEEIEESQRSTREKERVLQDEIKKKEEMIRDMGQKDYWRISFEGAENEIETLGNQVKELESELERLRSQQQHVKSFLASAEAQSQMDDGTDPADSVADQLGELATPPMMGEGTSSWTSSSQRTCSSSGAPAQVDQIGAGSDILGEPGTEIFGDPGDALLLAADDACEGTRARPRRSTRLAAQAHVDESGFSSSSASSASDLNETVENHHHEVVRRGERRSADIQSIPPSVGGRGVATLETLDTVGDHHRDKRAGSGGGRRSVRIAERTARVDEPPPPLENEAAQDMAVEEPGFTAEEPNTDSDFSPEESIAEELDTDTEPQQLRLTSPSRRRKQHLSGTSKPSVRKRPATERHERGGRVAQSPQAVRRSTRLHAVRQVEPEAHTIENDASCAALQQHRGDDGKYPCHYCHKRLTTRDGQRRHHKLHKEAYKCPECGEVVMGKRKIHVHKRDHAGGNYVCKNCSKGFLSLSHLERHERTHTGERPYPCVSCGRRFRQSIHLQEHQNTHASARPYICRHRGQGFSQSSNKLRHERQCKGSSTRPTQSQTDDRKASSADNALEGTCARPRRSTRPTVSMQVDQAHEVDAPEGGDDGLQAPVLPSTDTSRRPSLHQDTTRGKKGPAAESNQRTMGGYREEDGGYGQAAEDSVYLTVGSEFAPSSASSTLDTEEFYPLTETVANHHHARESIHEHVHTGEKPHAEDTHTRLEHLQKHERLHTGEKPHAEDTHTCPYEKCGKVFRKKEYLQRHKNIHTGKYKCQHCQRCFLRNDKLKSHERTHRVSHEDRKHKGGKTYAFACPHPGCPHTFPRKWHAKSHYRIKHLGERPYKCTYSGCDKTFTQPCHRSTHEIEHTNGHQRVECTYEGCGKTFSRVSSMVRHTKRSH